MFMILKDLGGPQKLGFWETFRDIVFPQIGQFIILVISGLNIKVTYIWLKKRISPTQYFHIAAILTWKISIFSAQTLTRTEFSSKGLEFNDYFRYLAGVTQSTSLSASEAINMLFTYKVKVSTPRWAHVISVLICSSSHFSLDTRSLAWATSDFNKSGSYFVLKLLVLEHTKNGKMKEKKLRKRE